MATYYIGADVHSNSIEMAIFNRKKIVQRYTVPASISAVVQVLESMNFIRDGPYFIVDSDRIVCYFVIMPRSSRMEKLEKLGTATDFFLDRR